MENQICYIFKLAILIVLFQSTVFAKPLTNNMDKSNTWIKDSILSAVSGESKITLEQSIPGHAFIKVDTIRDRTPFPKEANIVIHGDSSMRLFNDSDINHPSFDPSKFLQLASNESVQSVKVQPISGQPYFMFIPPALLKNKTFETTLFGNLNKKRRRVKRHHPTNTVQSVLGELQNYALVPIKSNNGQIRYILLKNPKFVIGNPVAANRGLTGQPAPAIIQLNSNRPAATPGGTIRYTPRSPIRPVTQPPFRRIFSGRRQAPVAVATPIDSIFNTQSSQMSRSDTKIAKTKSTKTTRTSSNVLKRKRMPSIPSTWQELRRKFIASEQTVKPISGTNQILIANNKPKRPTKPVGGANPIQISNIKTKQPSSPVGGANPILIGNIKTKQQSNPVGGANSILVGNIKTKQPSNSVGGANPILIDNIKTKQVGGTDANRFRGSNTIPVVGTKNTSFGGTKITPESVTNTVPIVKIKTNLVRGTKGSPIGQSKTTSVQQKLSSVAADKISSSASSLTKTADGVKAAVADTTLAVKEANESNVNQTNTKNITITKVGDTHKIEQTEIVETVVDVKKNATTSKSDTASSKVITKDAGHGHEHGGNGGHGHDHGGHGSHGHHGSAETVSANSGAAEKATAEKQAQVVKKTKKTTTILLKSGSETKSGKAEISEIQHTVEELVHHNTSEIAAAEKAASASVDAKTGEAHASHSHSHHSHDHAHAHAHEAHPGRQEKVATADAKKETNSTTTSVKTKSVKQTVIKKNIPDPNAPVNSNPASSIAASGTAGKSTGGFDVQHVEHVVQETEHKVQKDTSQTSKHKEESSAGNTSHDHHHHHH